MEWGKDLEKAGFREEELEQLQEILTQIASSQDTPAEKVVEQFFETVNRYGPIVSLELEIPQAEARAADAKAEAKHWEAKAQEQEGKCGARSSTIDAVERLLSQGISEEDLIQWEHILKGSGITTEDLSGSLNRYASLDALTKARKHEVDELQAQIPPLDSQVNSLTEQRDSAGAAVQVVREKALKEVAKAGRQAAREINKASEEAQRVVESLNAAGMNFGDLREEAATLKEYVMVARALSMGDPEVWRAFPNQVIKHVISGVLAWAQAEGQNIKLSPPSMLRYRAGISSLTRLSLSELLLWAMTGIFTEEERAALSTTI